MKDNLSHDILFLGIIYLVRGNTFIIHCLYDGIHCDFTCNRLLKFYFSRKENSHKKTHLNYHYFGDYREGIRIYFKWASKLTLRPPTNYSTKNCSEFAITTSVTPNPREDWFAHGGLNSKTYTTTCYLGNILPFNILDFEQLKALFLRFRDTLKSG